MTVILVLLFFITVIAIDAYKQHKIKVVAVLKNLPSDVMLNNANIGFTMADGGKKIEQKIENK